MVKNSDLGFEFLLIFDDLKVLYDGMGLEDHQGLHIKAEICSKKFFLLKFDFKINNNYTLPFSDKGLT